jgi:hypothetical protein
MMMAFFIVIMMAQSDIIIADIYACPHDQALSKYDGTNATPDV